MKQLLNKLEITTNNLNFTKSKINYPQFFKSEEYELELLRETEQEYELRKESEKITDIENIKNLIYNQLNEYIIRLDKDSKYPYSIRQNMTAPMFYLNPLIDVKKILLSNQTGISIPILVMTLSEKDTVKNKFEFLKFLKESRTDFNNSTDLYHLFTIYKIFEDKLKRNFC